MSGEPKIVAVVVVALLWLVAAFFVAVGVLIAYTLEGGSGSRLAIGALLISLAWPPLGLAMAVLVGDRVKDRFEAAAGAGLLLTLYALAAGAVAFWFGEETVIHGDTAWLAFWSLCVLSWVALGLWLVQRVGGSSH